MVNKEGVPQTAPESTRFSQCAQDCLLAPSDTNLLTGQKSNACVKIQIILDVQPIRFLIIKLVHSLSGDGYKYIDSVM